MSGAAMMPFLDSDVEDWPFKLSALAPHYAAVLQLTGLAACHDKLEERFPLYTDSVTELRPSRQSQQLLDRMGRNREALSRAGVHLGVRGCGPGESTVGGWRLRLCRLCMYGCPYGYIYTSSDSVTQLLKNPSLATSPE